MEKRAGNGGGASPESDVKVDDIEPSSFGGLDVDIPDITLRPFPGIIRPTLRAHVLWDSR